MLPDESILFEDEDTTTETEPSRTYRIDWTTGRVVGMTEGIDAVRQAVLKALGTMQGEHAIYGDSYGFSELIGTDEVYFRSEVKRRLTESVLEDDRVLAVENFQLDIQEDAAVVTCTIVSIFGEFTVEREV